MLGFERKVMKRCLDTQVVSNVTGLRDRIRPTLKSWRILPHLCSRPKSTSVQLHGCVSGHPFIPSITVLKCRTPHAFCLYLISFSSHGKQEKYIVIPTGLTTFHSDKTTQPRLPVEGGVWTVFPGGEVWHQAAGREARTES